MIGSRFEASPRGPTHSLACVTDSARIGRGPLQGESAMWSHRVSRFVDRRCVSLFRSVSLAALALSLSASVAMAQGGGMCQGGGGGAGGASSGGRPSGAGGGQSTGAQSAAGGQSGSSSLTTATESVAARAAAAGQHMRQAQQSQIDQMARVRRDVQQAAQQRVQQRTVALQARLAREEMIAESTAKRVARITASKKSNSFAANTVASTDSPTVKFPRHE